MKRTQKSQKRTKFLFVLIILTAILSITATYAWFSTQRDVEITNLHVRVESAENMQISLDGENWSQSIEIEDMKQLYGTHTPSGTETIYQANKVQNKNYIPTELLPVSADGTVTNGELNFVKGTLNGVKLSNITKCSETDIKFGSTFTGTTDADKATASIDAKEDLNANHPYLIFDIYLRNLSRKENDKLQLSYGSHVWVNTATAVTGVTNDVAGVAGTGLENAVRVGFVPQKTTANLTDDGSTVRTTTTFAGGEKAAIWEPNYKDHTQYVVNNNKRNITLTTETADPADCTKTYPVKFSVGGTTTTITDVNSNSDGSLSTTTQVLRPTYSLTAASVTDSEGAAVTGVIGTTQIVDLKDTAGTALTIPGNKISKVRVYLWLEGQDPDCIDLASTGKEVSATIRLEKEKNTTTGTLPSYQ